MTCLAFRQAELALEPEHGGTTNNTVVTSLYTCWNFIPLNLWKQFQRRQNVYFLFISVLQVQPRN